jgi:hypothetical protein
MTRRCRKSALLIAVLSACLSSQEQLNRRAIQDSKPRATVMILAFDTDGRFLGAPVVSIFESDGSNLAASFDNGIASGIPFGIYHVKGHVTGYSSDTVNAAVFQEHVTIVLGLAVGVELPIVPPILHGRVVKLSHIDDGRSFVRLNSLFAHESMDSSIGPDGSFALCGFTRGQYLLEVISERGLLASRLLSLPYTAASLEIVAGERASVKR